jgi:rhamnosyltransferase
MISIIIRTYNEEKNIGRCLDAVFNQKTNKSFEVIIVDSGSTDKTLEIAKKFNVRIIKITDFTFGKSLNKGIEYAKGKYCVLLSADVTPMNDEWLENLIKPLKSKNIAGVFGKEVPYDNCNCCEARRVIGTFERIPDGMFTSSNAVIKKGTWLKNKYDEKTTSSEDWFWAKKVKEKGYKIEYASDAIVLHSHNINFSKLFNRIKNQTYNIARLEKINPITLFLKGIMNFIYCMFFDLKFIRFNPLKIPFILIYELIVLLSFMSAAISLGLRK